MENLRQKTVKKMDFLDFCNFFLYGFYLTATIYVVMDLNDLF